jgi:positive regulator of sigma E activity
MQVRVADGLELKAGDQVHLDLPPDGLLRAAWLAYGLPLSTTVLAVAVAAAVVDPANDSALVASGVLGLAAGVLVGRKKLAGDRCIWRLTPVVCERIVKRRGEPGVAPPGPRVSGT